MTYRIQRGTIAYKAVEAIVEHGPMSFPLLCACAPMGDSEFRRKHNLQRGISNGWLVMDRNGRVTATSSARKQVLEDRGSANAPQYLEMVPPRDINLMQRPEYKPQKVYRREGPEWAKRPADFSFKTVA